MCSAAASGRTRRLPTAREGNGASIGPDGGDIDGNLGEELGGESAAGQDVGAAEVAFFEIEDFDGARFGGDDPDLGDSDGGIVGEFFLALATPVRWGENFDHEL